MKIVDQFPFEFYGSTFELFLTDKRSLILPVRALCEAMGLDSKSQLRRIENDVAMSDGLSMIVALGLRSDGSSQEREVACLSLRLLPYWHGTRIKGLEDCMSALEARLGGTDFISHQQARQYLDAVGILGDLLKETNPKKASPYAIIHNEVKRHFGVPTSYQLIPEREFGKVLEFLAKWWAREAPERPVPQIFLARQERLL